MLLCKNYFIVWKLFYYFVNSVANVKLGIHNRKLNGHISDALTNSVKLVWQKIDPRWEAWNITKQTLQNATSLPFVPKQSKQNKGNIWRVSKSKVNSVYKPWPMQCVLCSMFSWPTTRSAQAQQNKSKSYDKEASCSKPTQSNTLTR